MGTFSDLAARQVDDEVPISGNDDRPALTADGPALLLMGHAAFQYLQASCELGLFAN